MLYVYAITDSLAQPRGTGLREVPLQRIESRPLAGIASEHPIAPELDEEQEAPEGGEQPGLISGGIGGPSGTGRSGGTVGPGSGRNPGRR